MTRVRSSAFTLIEMLVVLAILVILAALLIPKLVGASHKRDIIACAGNLKKLGAAFSMYVLENKGYAPFNPNSREDGDNFYSWEALYQLGPYLDDPDHKKFEAGTWTTVRCPGNQCKYYRTGNSIGMGVDAAGDPVETGKYRSNWQNRQAPKLWPDPPFQTVVPNKVSGTSCSPGEQIVDYQYNVSLGGVFNPLSANNWFTVDNHPINYKLDFIVQIPSQAVIFCDIQYAIVLHRTNTSSSGVDKIVYAYPTGAAESRMWGGFGFATPNGAAPSTATASTVGTYMRTNERIHNGKGINAVFVDGHVEFLAGTAAYNGSQNIAIQDDLLNWGVSYPICYPTAAERKNQIPGIHGFRRRTNENAPAWCIEHEFKKGQGEVEAGACFGDGV